MKWIVNPIFIKKEELFRSTNKILSITKIVKLKSKMKKTKKRAKKNLISRKKSRKTRVSRRRK